MLAEAGFTSVEVHRGDDDLSSAYFIATKS
jgi:hypothetical protein